MMGDASACLRRHRAFDLNPVSRRGQPGVNLHDRPTSERMFDSACMTRTELAASLTLEPQLVSARHVIRCQSTKS